MSIFKNLEKLKKELADLQTDLQEARDRKEKAQDSAMIAIYEKQIGGYIDKIDSKQREIDTLEAQLPQKRTNGHHKAESEEEEQLKPDFKPDQDEDRNN